MTNGGSLAEPAVWQTLEDHSDGEHVLRVLGPGRGDWLEEVARVYRDLRIAAAARLEAVTLDGVTVLDSSAIMQRLTEASVPRGTHPVRAWAVPRSDLAEILLAEIMVKDFAGLLGYRATRDRELVESPGRGIDQIGVEVLGGLTEAPDGAVDFQPADQGPLLVLMLGEAKTTIEAASPPKVVDTNEDCLRSQHLQHLAEVEATAAKVALASRQCVDAISRAAYTFADFLLREQRFDLLRVASTSLLLRPAGVGGSTDFGSFQSSPEDYAPGVVRFVVFQLDDEDLEAAVDRFVSLAHNDEGGPGSVSDGAPHDESAVAAGDTTTQSGMPTVSGEEEG